MLPLPRECMLAIPWSKWTGHGPNGLSDRRRKRRSSGEQDKAAADRKKYQKVGRKLALR